ncbi:TIGR02391 family protein [Sphingomonas sp. gentR]|uniref:TIGR02391 family protein n=1 Tax=Sphingomonas sp. gentR TaxID=3118768 RepID=UPI00403F01DA
MPFAMIETELQDLARDLWKAKSDDDCALVRGYRRLEESAKIKSACTATKDLWGSIFGSDKGLLTWPNCAPDEAKGRMQLFQAVAGAFRNPRAHSENVDATHQLNEFLLLNFLFRLLKDSVPRQNEIDTNSL